VVAWAVMHFSANAPAPKQVEVQPPPAVTSERDFIPPPPPAETLPKIEDSAYQPSANEAQLPDGHGVLEVAAPEGTVVVVDGTERSPAPTKLPIASGSHEVRVKTPAPSSEERGCTVDVHASRVARVRF